MASSGVEALAAARLQTGYSGPFSLSCRCSSGSCNHQASRSASSCSWAPASTRLAAMASSNCCCKVSLSALLKRTSSALHQSCTDCSGCCAVFSSSGSCPSMCCNCSIGSACNQARRSASVEKVRVLPPRSAAALLLLGPLEELPRIDMSPTQ